MNVALLAGVYVQYDRDRSLLDSALPRKSTSALSCAVTKLLVYQLGYRYIGPFCISLT